jgi:hypothetical protein
MIILDALKAKHKAKRKAKRNQSYEYERYFYSKSEAIIARWAETEEGKRATRRVFELGQTAGLTCQEYAELLTRKE